VGSHVNARLEHPFLAFDNYCVKVNIDRPTLQQLSCRAGSLVSCTIKLVRVFMGFSRKETSSDSGVACHAHVLWSHAEVYSLCA